MSLLHMASVHTDIPPGGVVVVDPGEEVVVDPGGGASFSHSGKRKSIVS